MREKQIEEMAKTLCIYDDGNSYCFRRQCDKKCKYGKFAKALYDAGYRKARKNHIGTEKVLRSIDYRPVEEVRRETAKEFAEKIKTIFYYEFDEIIPSIMSYKIDELLKEYEK